MKEQISTMSLRIPKKVKKGVQDAARKEKRSMNTQITFILENYLKQLNAKKQESEAKIAA